MDSYLFKSVLTLVQSISLIYCSVYSLPKYIFELPDRTQATSLSLLSLMSLSSISFILGSIFFCDLSLVWGIQNRHLYLNRLTDKVFQSPLLYL